MHSNIGKINRNYINCRRMSALLCITSMVKSIESIQNSEEMSALQCTATAVSTLKHVTIANAVRSKEIT